MRLIFPLLLAPLLAGCPTTGGGSPITAYAIVSPEAMPPPSWILFDGEVLVARGQVAGEAGVLSKASGWPLFGPVTTSPGKTLVWRREGEERLEVAPGAPLPGWARGAFPPGMAERLGVEFEAE